MCILERLQPFRVNRTQNFVCSHPLITTLGTILATGRASPALLVKSITSSTFLYASGASSDNTFGVDACILMPDCSNFDCNFLPSMVCLALVLDNALPAPCQDEPKAWFWPFIGPAIIHEPVPISPGTRTGWPVFSKLLFISPLSPANALVAPFL